MLEGIMSVSKFKSLLQKSGELNRAIKTEQRKQLPNWLKLKEMKKARLDIKDHLLKLTNQYSSLYILFCASQSQQQIDSYAFSTSAWFDPKELEDITPNRLD